MEPQCYDQRPGSAACHQRGDPCSDMVQLFDANAGAQDSVDQVFIGDRTHTP